MAKVGAQRAAELTGKSKSTIQRAMNGGKLSFEVDANQRRVIDVSELERVFGLAPQQDAKESGAGEDELRRAGEMIEMERMKMRIRMLEDALESAQAQLEDMRQQRDQWQKQSQQILITSQYSQKQAEDYKAEIKAREAREQERHRALMEKKRRRQIAERRAAQQTETTGQSKAIRAEDVQDGKLDFQSLWKKIKGEGEAA